MNTRRIALAFLFTLGVGAPLALTAETDGPPEIEIAPRFVESATIAALELEATVVKSTSRLVQVRITGKNAGAEPVDAQIEVVARRSAEGSEMARMPPQPEVVARRSVSIQVGAGEELDQVVTFDKLHLGSARGLKQRPVYASLFTSAEHADAALALAFDMGEVE